MPSASRGARARLRVAALSLTVLLVPPQWASLSMPAQAEESKRASARSLEHGGIQGAPPSARFPLAGSGAASVRTLPTDSGGWWLASLSLAMVLALLGLRSLAIRQRWPGGGWATLAIVGRVSLSSRHQVVAIQVGENVLLVGIGPQGPPSLLTELSAMELKSRPPKEGDWASRWAPNGDRQQAMDPACDSPRTREDQPLGEVK